MNDERLKYKLEFYDALLDYWNVLKKEGKKIAVYLKLSEKIRPFR